MSKVMVGRRCRHYLISGRVQGVGFRRFVENQAQKFGVAGRVRNLDDGRVEVLACGDENQMCEFDALMRRGPLHAAVSHVDCHDVQASAAVVADLTGFSIVEDGGTPWSIKS
jgi:acylphosphatase